MNKIKNTFQRVWNDESGQGATEYILILVVVSAIIIAFREPILKIITQRTEAVGDKLKETMDNI